MDITEEDDYDDYDEEIEELESEIEDLEKELENSRDAWYNQETKGKGINQFYEMEKYFLQLEDKEYVKNGTMMAKEDLIVNYKANFLWEYSKNLEKFLDYTFAEDGTLMSYVLPPDTPMETPQPEDPMEMLKNPLVLGIIGLGLFMMTRGKGEEPVVNNQNSNNA
tara:strand:- start:14 stop:508 length:495 start_codon:yes stop_codon:yes gene_type:complete